MHIPQHVLDPATCAAAGAISTAALSYAIYRVKNEDLSTKLPLMALTGVAVLVAQSLNFPIASGASGHFLGGALAGILLGPWAGMLVVAAVVAIQCFVLNDGGMSALGANILNMAVIGSFVGHGVYAQVKSSLNGRRGMIAGAVAGAWCSIMASAVACSLELSFGGGFPAAPTFAAMLSLHSLISIGEMLLTGIAIGVASEGVARVNWRIAAVGLACAAVAVITLSPFVSRLPDGLETVVPTATGHAVHP